MWFVFAVDETRPDAIFVNPTCLYAVAAQHGWLELKTELVLRFVFPLLVHELRHLLQFYVRCEAKRLEWNFDRRTLLVFRFSLLSLRWKWKVLSWKERIKYHWLSTFRREWDAYRVQFLVEEACAECPDLDSLRLKAAEFLFQ